MLVSLLAALVTTVLVTDDTAVLLGAGVMSLVPTAVHVTQGVRGVVHGVAVVVQVTHGVRGVAAVVRVVHVMRGAVV